MKNKYYIPDTEDIHIGYEGEYHNVSMDELGTPELNYNRWDKTILNKHNIKIMLEYGITGFRTKYLTKEDIESLGWKLIKDSKDRYTFEKRVPDSHQSHIDLVHRLLFLTHYKVPSISIELEKAPSFFSICYNGMCPSKNELRVIQKLLNI